MKANIGIALGVNSCVLGATGIGVSGKALAFASKSSGVSGRLLTNIVSDIAEHASKGEIILEDISNGTDFVLGDGSHLPNIPISSTPFLKSASDSLTSQTIQTDLMPIIEWNETDYIPFEDELDDPSKQAVMLDCALDLCNRLRSSLKPTFNALATRINEITNENDNASNQINKIEININKKFKAYINKYDLTCEDIIDVLAKIDNEHHILSFEFEDDVVNGLIVFKTFATNNSASRPTSLGSASDQRRFYIIIADGAITDYKGVQNNEITIDSITIKPLTKSEDDRLAYMSNANLMLDSTEKLISEPIDSNYIINGVVVEQCACTKQMIYQVSDLAYI